LQIGCPNLAPLQALWKNVAPKISLPDKFELAVDVDPMNLR
jgi:hypothetical protein